MHRITSIVYSETDHLRDLVARMGGLEVLAQVRNGFEAESALTEDRPDILFVDLGATPDTALGVVEKLDATGTMIVVYGPDEAQWVLKAMRAGAREYIAAKPDEADELAGVLARLGRELAENTPKARGSLVAVMGTKGGVGATFTACQLAAMLARSGDSVAVVDGHFRMGDVALHLDLTPDYTVADLTGTATLDATFLRSTLTSHASGVHVLASPKRPEEADMVTADSLGRVLNLLVEDFDWVIWDLPDDYSDTSVLVADRAELVLLVATPDVPALHHTSVQVDLLRRLGHDPARIRTIFNRYDKNAAVSDGEAKSFLGRPVDAVLPNEYARASACVNEGRTLDDTAPKSPIARAFGRLAADVREWCGRTDVSASANKTGFLSRLRRK